MRNGTTCFPAWLARSHSGGVDAHEHKVSRWRQTLSASPQQAGCRGILADPDSRTSPPGYTMIRSTVWNMP